MCLQDNCKYNDYNTLEQTLVITEKDENVFYVWNHYFQKKVSYSKLKILDLNLLSF